MTTTVSISLSFIEDPAPCLPPGVHHIGEIMPDVLATYELELPDGPAAQSELPACLDLLIDCLESALAG